MFVLVSCFQGYRHVQLRTQHNEQLEVSSLFIFSRRVEEGPTGVATPSSLVGVVLALLLVFVLVCGLQSSNICKTKAIFFKVLTPTQQLRVFPKGICYSQT